tara:strand:+ start:1076 stop:1288 length:213 start_codon:yes stop_codon:yes gene_type:complete
MLKKQNKELVMQVNEIVAINTYELRAVGKIVYIGQDHGYGIDVIKVQTANGQVYECCEEDLMQVELGVAA